MFIYLHMVLYLLYIYIYIYIYIKHYIYIYIYLYPYVYIYIYIYTYLHILLLNGSRALDFRVADVIDVTMLVNAYGKHGSASTAVCDCGWALDEDTPMWPKVSRADIQLTRSSSQEAARWPSASFFTYRYRL